MTFWIIFPLAKTMVLYNITDKVDVIHLPLVKCVHAEMQVTWVIEWKMQGSDNSNSHS
jgi:hypothetical protein